MIVAAFLNWATTARSADRAKAASALARAYLQDQLDTEQRDAALTAMAHLVSDPSASVRRALAQALASSRNAPRHILLALAGDQPDVAAEVLVLSPQLSDDDLIELCVGASSACQSLIASRQMLSLGLIAALCEVAECQALTLLLEREDISLNSANLTRLSQRFAAEPVMRGLLLDRDDLPLVARQMILASITQDLAQDQCLAHLMGEGVLRVAAAQAERSATIFLLEQSASTDLSVLISSLVDADQLTVDLLLCLAALGLGDAVAEALVQLTAGDHVKIRRALSNGRQSSLMALFRTANLPPFASQLLCEITVFWRSAQSFDPLADLLSQLRINSLKRDDQVQRMAAISLLDHLVQERRFDHVQDDLRQLMLQAA